jgi:hypothetical protein
MLPPLWIYTFPSFSCLRFEPFALGFFEVESGRSYFALHFSPSARGERERLTAATGGGKTDVAAISRHCLKLVD